MCHHHLHHLCCHLRHHRWAVMLPHSLRTFVLAHRLLLPKSRPRPENVTSCSPPDHRAHPPVLDTPQPDGLYLPGPGPHSEPSASRILFWDISQAGHDALTVMLGLPPSSSCAVLLILTGTLAHHCCHWAFSVFGFASFNTGCPDWSVLDRLSGYWAVRKP